MEQQNEKKRDSNHASHAQNRLGLILCDVCVKRWFLATFSGKKTLLSFFCLVEDFLCENIPLIKEL